MNTLAIFDLDKTITKKDTLLDFLRFQNGNSKLIWELFKCTPTLVLYKFKLLSNNDAKERLFRHFFGNIPEVQLVQSGNKYSESNLPNILNPEAISRINFHLKQNHKLIIISASPRYWIEQWANSAGFSHIICTELEISNGILTGNFKGQNCYGIEKVKRLKKDFDLDKFDYIYVYGDSKGDREILELADESYLNFKRIK